MSKKQRAESEAVVSAQEKYGQCVAVFANGVEFVFRPLELDEFEDFQSRVRTSTNHGPINRECCQVALVDDKQLEALKETMKKAPGFAPMVAQSIMEMALSGIEISVKKK